jgi:hypothetical protein
VCSAWAQIFLFDAALALENREFLLLFDAADKTEGMHAFLDKRRPNFSGD